MSDTSYNTGLPLNPYTIGPLPQGQAAAMDLGVDGTQLISKAHGDAYLGARLGTLFSFNVTAVTVPLVANNLVSVFTLYNPIGSGKYLELLEFNYGTVLATTVVDTIGLYYQSQVKTQSATFTTKGVMGTNWFNGLPALQQQGVGQPYSAFTHSGTPVRIAICGTWGAVTSTNESPCSYKINGRIVLSPGDAVSAAMTTAASTASGVDLELVWNETT